MQYSAELYATLEEETGVGFRRCGGVTVARTPDRMAQLRRTAATAEAYHLECELISPARARELYPIMQVADLAGAIWLPGDGRANPTDLTAALARGARDRGVTVCERTRVTGILTAGGAVSGVRTGQGDVEAEVVVNCAGQWAKQVGAMCGVTVPLHSAEHFYVVTEQIDGVHPGLPILRDPDGYTYIKEEVGGLAVGGFEPEAKPWLARRDQEVLQRTGELYPGQPVHPRRGTRAAELLRRRGLQLRRHRISGRSRPGPGRVDHRGRAEPGPVRGRHPALRPL